MFEAAVKLDRAAFRDVRYNGEHFEQAYREDTLFRFLGRRAHSLAAIGKLADAAAASRSILKGARLMLSAGGFTMDHGVHRHCKELAVRLMCDLARNPAASRRPSAAAARRSGRRSRHSARQAAPRGAAQFNHSLMPILLKTKDADLPTVIRIFGGEGRFEIRSQEAFEQRCELVSRILEGHPKPFDLIHTVRYFSKRYVAAIRDLDIPFPEYYRASEPWPPEGDPWPLGLGFDFGDESERPTDVTDTQIAKARRFLKTIHNPLGKRFDYPDLLIFVGRVGHTRDQAQRQGRTLLLAAIIYLREKGELPPDLDALVTAGIIKQLPRDAYTDQPFAYSRALRKIWRQEGEGDRMIDLETPDEDSWLIPIENSQRPEQ